MGREKKEEKENESKQEMQGGASSIPQVGVITFTLGVACSSQEDGCCSMEVYYCTEIPTAAPSLLYSMPPTPDFPHMTPICTSFPLGKPKLSVCEPKTCALAPLRKKKGVPVSGGFHFSQQTKPPWLVTAGICKGG